MTTPFLNQKSARFQQVFLCLIVVLLLFPLQRTGFQITPRLLITSLICGALVLALQIQLGLFFKPPRWLRWVLLPALICAPPFSIISLPSPFSVLIPLFALVWVLSHAPLRLSLWTRFTVLSLYALRAISLSDSLPVFEFPRFPSATPIWISIALVIPLGIATQQRLRPFAKGLLLFMGCLAYLAASLTPLTLQFATGYKEVGEAELDFYALDPLPGFRINPEYNISEILPETFQGFPDPFLAMEILDNMNLRLQPNSLIFSDPPDEEDLFLLQQGGFVLKDRFGLFVPASVYGTPDLPEEMSDEILPLVNELAQRTSFPADQHTRPTLLRLRNLNLVDTIPGNSSRFRLTPQARKPFGNGLYPRQILFAHAQKQKESSARITHATYAPRWDLSFERTRQELIYLEELGLLVVDETPAWYTAAYDRIVFPPKDVAKGVVLPLLGMLLLWWGMKPSRTTLISVGCFSTALLLQFATPFSPPPYEPLVVQAVWTTLWLPFSLLLIGLSFGLDQKENEEGPEA